MKSYLPLILFAVAFTSCAPFIFINDNEYRLLSEEQLAQVRQFGDPPPADSNDQFLVEITVNDLVASFKNAEYTWVHRWVPHCTGETCKPLYYYDKILQDNKDKGLQLFMISSTYDYKNVKKQLPYFSEDIYVIKDARYGHNHGRNVTYFLKELQLKGYIGEQPPRKEMLFKGDSLIYSTHLMTHATMDSAIKATR